MVEVKIIEILKERQKTKYWFIKNMNGSYQSLSKLMENKSTGIKFSTLERICEILDCEPGEIIVIKK